MGFISEIKGSLCIAKDIENAHMYDIAEIGNEKLIGEIIKIAGNKCIIQVFEETEGLKPFEKVESTGKPLSLKLGPGLIGSIYDGIQRPLVKLETISGCFISRGIKTEPLGNKKWTIHHVKKNGDKIASGEKIAYVNETDSIKHYILAPNGINGTIAFKKSNEFTINDVIATIDDGKQIHRVTMFQIWPCRVPRPIIEKLNPDSPLITGLRVIDTFFPIAEGGAACIPGGFGTGKTMVQQSLAKWASSDIIVYVGCGERGNEMTDVLEQFPTLIDPRTGKPLMQRTVLIANTSNMPVAAREISIYTGVTIAEYFRDMGYSVALIADSTSRWAEALRELGGRLEEMPAEEGFPAYLPSRLASFYERASKCKTLSKEIGAVTIIGAISPPGGDFSEPVTQHTRRFVRTYWELDRQLAYERHYPAISWLNSYSEYINDLTDYYNQKNSLFLDLRSCAMDLLQREEKLQQIIKLIGPDALPDRDKLVLKTSELIKQSFLQQNAYDDIDHYCTMEKSFFLLKIIIEFYLQSKQLLEQGVTISQINSIKLLYDIPRLKYTVSNDNIEALKQFNAQLAKELELLKKQ